MRRSYNTRRGWLDRRHRWVEAHTKKHYVYRCQTCSAVHRVSRTLVATANVVTRKYFAPLFAEMAFRPSPWERLFKKSA